MAQQDDIVIKVDIDAQKVQGDLENAITNLQRIKAEQADLNKKYAESRKLLKEKQITEEEYNKVAEEYGRATAKNRQQTAELNKTIKDNTAMVTAATIEEVKANATLDQKRAALNALQKVYGQLTDEQKKAEIGGKTLTDRIKELSDAVKEEESAIGDNRRNVGNYEEAIKSVVPGMGKMSSILGTLKKVAMLAAGGFTALAAGIKAALVSMLKFLATPAGAIIAAIALALAGLVKAFSKLNEQIKKNDDASTAFARIYATTIEPIVNAVTAAFTKLAEAVGKAAGKVADFLAKFSDAGKAADDRVKAIDNLEEAERQYVEKHAERDSEIAKLRAKAVDAENYSVEERRDALQQALELEKQDLADRKAIAAEKLRLLEEEAKLNGDTSDAMKDRIAQARAAMLNAETDYYNGTLKMQKQLQSFNREIDAEDQRRLEEYKKRAAERKQAAVEAYWEEREVAEAIANAAKSRGTKNEVIEEDEDDTDAEAQLEKQKQLMARMRELQKTELQKQYEDELAWLTELHDNKLISEQDFLEKKAELQRQYEEQARLDQAAAVAEWSQQILGSISAVNDAISAAEKAELQDYKDGQERRKKMLDQRLAAGEISEEEHAQEIARIEEQTERREKEMEIEQAKRQKALGIMNAVINTAAAIINALATVPFPASIAMATLAGITGAAQTAVIAAEPIPKFASGGMVGGNQYTGDKVLARLNSGEGVLTAKGVENTTDLVAGLDNGTLGFNYELMAETLKALPAPVMAYEEFKSFEQDVTTYNEIARV